MAKDIYHQIVKQALIKDGWTITNDPYLIQRQNRKPYEVDLGAEKFIAAEKGSEHIAVEIKSFIGSSMTYDFHTAFGKYGVYRFFMDERDPARKLFLAIPEEVFNSFFLDADIQAICEHFKVNILVFDFEAIQIVSWIKR
ncbi:MAG: element excision factor XisH family protein [Saprospiraceae bacterium]